MLKGVGRGGGGEPSKLIPLGPDTSIARLNLIFVAVSDDGS